MKRIAICGALVLVVLVAVASLLYPKHFRTEELTPAQLHAKLATPPEDPCYDLDRARASEPIDATNRPPARNTEQLSADEIAIYRILIARWSSEARVKIYSKTFPLELDRIDCACFKGMDPEMVLVASHSYRYLTRDVLPGKRAILVSPGSDAAHIRDPGEGMQQGESVDVAVKKAFESGLFSLSQIVFDKEHRRAVVGFRFHCGSLCGNGSTDVFEKVGRMEANRPDMWRLYLLIQPGRLWPIRGRVAHPPLLTFARIISRARRSSRVPHPSRSEGWVF